VLGLSQRGPRYKGIRVRHVHVGRVVRSVGRSVGRVVRSVGSYESAKLFSPLSYLELPSAGNDAVGWIFSFLHRPLQEAVLSDPLNRIELVIES
jgi:hypothetical protein